MSTPVAQSGASASGAKLTGVIVTYKSSKTISAALASAKKCVDAGVLDLIVVDNASPDDTRDILGREATFAKVILGDANIGFGRGCNVGLQATTTPYVVFFNPDAQMEPDAVRTIVNFMDAHERCGICGPAILSGEGHDAHIQAVGALPRVSDIVGDALGVHTTYKRCQQVRPGAPAFLTDWVSGSMLVGRTQLLQQLGGFDPRYFLYWEEADLCRRVLAANYEIWAVPQATVSHIGGVSAAEESSDRIKGCIAKFYYESRHYYMRKHFGVVPATLAELTEVVALPVYELLRKLTRRSHQPPLRRWSHPILKLPKVVS
jgi:N-acetylglucosaminyl-diphospho-decaprenol L-rhamnosyltransferase